MEMRDRIAGWAGRVGWRRMAPVAAAIVLNVSMVAGFAAASAGAGKSVTPVGRPPEPIAVTLVLADFIPPPRRPARQAAASPDAAGASLSTRKRKANGPAAPTPEIGAAPDAAGGAGDTRAALAPGGIPAGLRSLLEKPEPCGPTSERLARADCRGRYAKLVPPVDDWSLPDLKYYEARFGHVEGVKERHERFKLLFALMGKPAGAQDPMGQ